MEGDGFSALSLADFEPMEGSGDAGAAVELIDDVPSAVEVVERTAAEAQDEPAA
jgi:hypothetical protein